ncbi:MAG TPA: CvpA family protein [Tepidisphaeraceae bacterium]|jgi:hypothetical protein
MSLYNIILIVMLLTIGFFHYTQGLFSATISAVLAVVAALVAVSYHEPLAAMFSKGRFADESLAITLVSLFALTYIVLRLLFDKFIPGNVLFPNLVDKIGGAVMGIIVAIFALGVVTLAAETLPFHPTIAGYGRYPVSDRDVIVSPNGNRSVDATVSSELNADTLAPEAQTTLLPPVDDIVLSMVRRQSDGGALCGRQRLVDIHPDYLQELFGQRLGVQVGAQRSALNDDIGHRWVNVDAVYQIDKVPQLDAEMGGVRHDLQLPKLRAAESGKVLLVLRTKIDPDATDHDRIFRFSPAAAPLIYNGVNNFPIGTLEAGKVLFVNKPDDFLFLDVSNLPKSVDLVYEIDEGILQADSSGARQVADGAFLAMKRFGRVDLSGKTVEPKSKLFASLDVAVMRKTVVLAAAETLTGTHLQPAGSTAGTGAMPGTTPKPGPGQMPQPPAEERYVFKFSRSESSPKLFSAINIPGKVPEGPFNVAGAGGMLKDGKFAALNADGGVSLDKLAEGADQVNEFFVPPGMQMVQVTGTPPPAGDAWKWADQLRDFELIDSDGKRYAPAGAWAKLKGLQDERMVAAYGPPAELSLGHSPAGRPIEAWIAFLIPQNAKLKDFQLQKKSLHQF